MVSKRPRQIRLCDIFSDTNNAAETSQTDLITIPPMCGRAYKTFTEEELYLQYLSKRPLNLIDFTPVYNLCPTEKTVVLRLVDGERAFEEMRWQLVPNFEPDFTTKLSTINAKSETVFESRLFADLVVRQRCIVPLSGFFEWKNDGYRKRPFKIHLHNNTIMGIAAIWETWRPGTPAERRSFSILTTAANNFMREIHDRMPVILDDAAVADWLDPEIHERKALEEILQPCRNEWLTAVEVSSLVNSAKNNGPELLLPITVAPEAQGRLFSSLGERSKRKLC
jgi:putative SOS response-associated peptidase YedK